MMSPPILRLPDFTLTFVVECDAFGTGLGAILMQEGHPIAFLSKALKGQAFYLLTYENELLSLVTVVQHWRPYLLGQTFIVRIDQQALRYLLDQQVGTVSQQRWVSKLFGFDFRIEYKRGHENKVVDSLSRIPESNSTQEHMSLSLISFPTPSWVLKLKASYLSDQHTTELPHSIQRGEPAPKGFSFQQGLILRKDKLWIVRSSPFQRQLLDFIHADPTAGHSGYHKTIHRAKANFYWKGMKADIKQFVRECSVCQANKHETVLSPGLLQPLPIPSHVWSDITMDFIEGLPVSHKFSVILVIMDRLTKYGHTTATVAQTFLANILKLHGMPSTIVSD
jgi:hypothetical protein